jgi:hypothetical protein
LCKRLHNCDKRSQLLVCMPRYSHFKLILVASVAFVQIRVARFFLVQHTKTGKIYQITTKYTKWSQNIPNDRKIDQMAIQYTKSLKNVTQIRNLGLKNCHLAILVQIRRLHVHAYFILQFILAALRMEAYLAYVVPTLCLCCAYVTYTLFSYVWAAGTENRSVGSYHRTG